MLYTVRFAMAGYSPRFLASFPVHETFYQYIQYYEIIAAQSLKGISFNLIPGPSTVVYTCDHNICAKRLKVFFPFALNICLVLKCQHFEILAINKFSNLAIRIKISALYMKLYIGMEYILIQCNFKPMGVFYCQQMFCLLYFILYNILYSIFKLRTKFSMNRRVYSEY